MSSEIKVGLVPGMTKRVSRPDGSVNVSFLATIEGVGSVGGSYAVATKRFYWPEKYGDKFTGADEFETQIWKLLRGLPKLAADFA